MAHGRVKALLFSISKKGLEKSKRKPTEVYGSIMHNQPKVVRTVSIPPSRINVDGIEYVHIPKMMYGLWLAKGEIGGALTHDGVSYYPINDLSDAQLASLGIKFVD